MEISSVAGFGPIIDGSDAPAFWGGDLGVPLAGISLGRRRSRCRGVRALAPGATSAFGTETWPAGQLSTALTGRTVTGAHAAYSPHRLAWHSGGPTKYGARVTGAAAHGGLVELLTDGPSLVLPDVPSPRLLPAGTPLPWTTARS